MDRQTEAFTGATEADWQVEAGQCEVYGPDDPRPIASPQEWNGRGWDAGRQPPKTLEEAKAALAARIADPNAPDDESVAGAYDHLGDR
jgi:hypothetical protein